MEHCKGKHNNVRWDLPERKGRQGRPRKTWCQTFKDDLWTEDIKWEDAEDATRDRIHWKKLAALCTSSERNQ